jgi:polar amino acid transport system substrate-binding protein
MPATLSCLRALAATACAVLAVRVGPAAAAPAPALELFTTPYAPFSYNAEDGRITGMSADVVIETARRAGVAITMHTDLPWARAMGLAQERRDTCAFSVARRPEREALYQWVGPIAVNKWALFARSDFSGHIDTLEDAKPYRVGGLRGDAKIRFLTDHGIEVDLVADDRMNAAKLAAGRIDLWVSSLYTARDAAAGEGVKNLKLVLVFHEAPSYLACSPGTSAETIARLNAALEALRKEGFVKKVHELHASRFAWY